MKILKKCISITIQRKNCGAGLKKRSLCETGHFLNSMKILNILKHGIQVHLRILKINTLLKDKWWASMVDTLICI